MRASLCMLTALLTAQRCSPHAVAAHEPPHESTTKTPLPSRRRTHSLPSLRSTRSMKTTRILQETFAKPQTDSKTYRLIELASGVRCLLVQDPRAEKCAAALDVHVGTCPIR